MLSSIAPVCPPSGVSCTVIHGRVHLPSSEKMLLYDEVDTDLLQCYHEMTLANLIFYAMKEGACSELSARMTAMDSASKNAGD